MKKTTLLFFILAYFVACKNVPKPHETANDPTIDTEKIEARTPPSEEKKNIADSSTSQNLSCLELLKMLVDKSNIDPLIKQMKSDVHMESFADSIVTIYLTGRNEERHEDVIFRWLKLNLAKKELSDVTINPDKPVILKYDTAIFNRIMKTCDFR